MFDIQTGISVAAFTGAGLCMGLGAIGAALGEGVTAKSANEALARNPALAPDIFKTMLVGQAVAESASIFSLVIAMILLFSKFPAESYLTVVILFSAGLCMGIGAIGSGIGSGLPAGAACRGIARQPAMSKQLNTAMLISSAICQTSSIYAMVTSFILLYSDFSAQPFAPTWAALLGAGIASGVGAIGAGVGEGLVAEAGCEGIARQPDSAKAVTNVMLLGMAVTETTAIYSLLISIILMFRTYAPTTSLGTAMALMGAGLCMGCGSLGPAVGEGHAGSSAVKWVSRNVGSTADITRVMLIGQAVTESTGIYSMVISLVLIFVI